MLAFNFFTPILTQTNLNAKVCEVGHVFNKQYLRKIAHLSVCAWTLTGLSCLFMETLAHKQTSVPRLTHARQANTTCCLTICEKRAKSALVYGKKAL